MKTEIETRLISQIVNHFCNELIREVRELRDALKEIGVEIDKMLEEPFSYDTPIRVFSYYSIDRDQYFIVFNKHFEDDFKFISIFGNPIPVHVFDFRGDNVDSRFIKLTLASQKQNFPIDYSFVFSQSNFSKWIKDIKGLAIEIIKRSIASFEYQKNNDRIQYVSYLDSIKEKLGELFFDESVAELTIDKFIEENPVIIEQGLSLSQLKHQVILKNVMGKYEHDLKPDVIAFDLREKCWVVVDYKKAKSTIIKNLQKVRTGFKSEVNNLESQLFDYVEYFDEEEHRCYVLKQYNISVDHPKGIGIIGNVNVNEEIAFNRLMKNKPRWFSVIPYNYLYDNFCRYVEMVRSLRK